MIIIIISLLLFLPFFSLIDLGRQINGFSLEIKYRFKEPSLETDMDFKKEPLKRLGLKTGLKNGVFWAETGSGFRDQGSPLLPKVMSSTPGLGCFQYTSIGVVFIYLTLETISNN